MNFMTETVAWAHLPYSPKAILAHSLEKSSDEPRDRTEGLQVLNGPQKLEVEKILLFVLRAALVLYALSTNRSPKSDEQFCRRILRPQIARPHAAAGAVRTVLLEAFAKAFSSVQFARINMVLCASTSGRQHSN